MGKAIIINNEDRLSLQDYQDYKDIQKAVDGMFECVGLLELPLNPYGSMATVNVFCNENFLIENREDFEKVNAVATLFAGQPIYGNVCLLIQEGDDNRGFEYIETEEGEKDICECGIAEDALLLAMNRYEKEIRKLHEQFDGYKPEPSFQMISFDNPEDMLDYMDEMGDR